MSVSEETLQLIKEAVKNGGNPSGRLIRSKLTNQLLWQNSECDKNDPVTDYLATIDAETQREPILARNGSKVFGEILSNCRLMNDDKTQVERATHKNRVMHDKENWQDQWQILKSAGKYCSFCKSNQEGREVYLSHNLKDPNGELACPILKECICNCCGGRGHTVAYCPANKTGTSILKMINRQNRIY
ncbi:uncharacterized protein LOC129774023 [Toxorhynchites rutilus septentrionalis]|uniref:uncharacterized protein LOC129774023 n=1 Tax=Toxorhynchites rutilus septentrionalis TaxID=329112 RepID=UPI00247A02B2|nr:uncharacterized protein LOC129774023 [Toxorhynchites rutilus septentrionalis]